MYVFKEDEHKAQYEARYWNCSGINICIVASVTKGVDWAAYIGADTSGTEREALQYALDYGCKLSAKDAAYFFPELKELRYRR